MQNTCGFCGNISFKSAILSILLTDLILPSDSSPGLCQPYVKTWLNPFPLESIWAIRVSVQCFIDAVYPLHSWVRTNDCINRYIFIASGINHRCLLILVTPDLRWYVIPLKTNFGVHFGPKSFSMSDRILNIQKPVINDSGLQSLIYNMWAPQSACKYILFIWGHHSQ